ncbi:hypothetical protein MBLNU230_g7353t1 [Neophaeotheca triangularis]
MEGSMSDRKWSSMEGALHNSLRAGIAQMGYEYLTPVQLKVLSELPNFQSDCLVQAKTGTGKTLAFLLPALHSLLHQSRLPRGQVAILIVSPTRELALQIAKEGTSATSQLRKGEVEFHTAYGGSSKARELNAFMSGDPKVLVATPGRLNDYLSDPAVAQKFRNLRTFILDEADTMLETGFLPSIQQILRQIPPKASGWQGMCFSATVPAKIHTVLPFVLKPGFSHLTTVNANEAPTLDRILQHSVIAPSVQDVFNYLDALLKNEQAKTPGNFKIIVFGATANGVALMASIFSNIFGPRSNTQVFQLHSRLSQSARVRTTNDFKATPAGIMFASDVIGRGMDFPNVSLVIQVGLPSSGDQYTHRVGRTARAGNEGRAVILLTQREGFWLKVNKSLPIKPYPTDLSASANSLAPEVQGAFQNVDEVTKSKAYQAWLGFHKTFTKQLQLTNEGLVEEANAYSASLGCPEPPAIEKQTIGKMGLKGVKGLRIGQAREGGGGRRPHGGATRGGRSNGDHSAPNGSSAPKGPPSGGGRGRGGRAPRGGRVAKGGMA